MERLKKISGGPGGGFFAGQKNMTLKPAAKSAALVSFLAAFLAGCLVPQGGQQAGLNLSRSSRDDNYYERRNRESRTRESTLSRSKDRYSGPDCEEEKDCRDICRKIYRSAARNECEELAADQVENLWHIYKTFERPSASALDEIDAEDFKVFVDLDRRPLDKALGSRLSSSEGRRVIAWMMASSDIVEIFEEADDSDDFDVLKDLLKSLDDDDYQEAMKERISDGKSFMELAIEEQGKALEWLHNFIEDQADGDWEDHEDLGVLHYYCGMDFNEENWIDILDYDRLLDAVKEIVERYTTRFEDDAKHNDTQRAAKGSPSATVGGIEWWTEDLRDDPDDAADLGEDQDIEDLCGPLTNTKNSGGAETDNCASTKGSPGKLCIVKE